MGNETFYCVQCGIRVSGLDPRGDRSHCPGCLGLPAAPTPPPSRDSSKRIRRPSSGALVAVAARPRTTQIVRPKPSRAMLIGGLSIVGAAVFLLASLISPRNPVVVAPTPPAAAPERPELPRPLEAPPAVANQTVPFATTPPAPPERAELPWPLEAPPDKVPRPVLPPPAPVDPAIETLAGEIEEAASALADEGRFEDALARIRSFPAEYRRTRAGASLEGLKRQIEARARSK